MKNKYSGSKIGLLCAFIFGISVSEQSMAQSLTKIASGSKNSRLIMPKGTNRYTNIRATLQSKNGTMWFATTGAGIYRLDGEVFTNFTIKDGLADNVVYCIYEGTNGSIWFGTNKGVSIYDGKKFTKFSLPGMDDNSFIPNKKWIDLKNSLNTLNVLKTVLTIVGDRNGNIWFGTENMGLYRYNRKGFANFKYNGKTWIEKSKDSLLFNDGNYINGIQTIISDKKANIWFSSIGSGGVYKYDGKTFYNIKDKTLVKSDVFCMLEDKIGNIWLGTREHGVFKYDGKSFSNFNEKDGFCSKNITCISEDKQGKIWFGSTQFDEVGKKEGCVTLFDGKAFKRFSMDKLTNTSVWSIYEDKSANIWLGMRNAQLYRYNGKDFINLSSEN